MIFALSREERQKCTHAFRSFQFAHFFARRKKKKSSRHFFFALSISLSFFFFLFLLTLSANEAMNSKPMGETMSCSQFHFICWPSINIENNSKISVICRKSLRSPNFPSNSTLKLCAERAPQQRYFRISCKTQSNAIPDDVASNGNIFFISGRKWKTTSETHTSRAQFKNKQRPTNKQKGEEKTEKCRCEWKLGETWKHEARARRKRPWIFVCDDVTVELYSQTDGKCNINSIG